jgi:hypothetical protein
VEPLDPFDEELQVCFNSPEIDVLGIASWHQGVEIVWHAIDLARGWWTGG